MKRFVLGMTALALSVGVLAQTAGRPNPTPTNVAIRLGAAYPFDDTARNRVRSFIGVGIDYTFPTQYIRGSDTFFSIDWFGKTGSGDRGNIFAFMVNQRFYGTPENNHDSTRAYGFIGAGVANVDIIRARAVLAGRGGFGFNFGQHIFAEAALLLTANAEGTRGHNIGAYIGYRF